MQAHAFGTLAAAAFTASALGQTATFELIPFALGANDMSSDGRYIVGPTDFNGDGFPDGTYIYDSVLDDLVILPPQGLDAVAVSEDGTVVLGQIEEPGGTGRHVAAIWTADKDSWESIGYLPEANPGCGFSTGYELSADGSVAVGLSWTDCDGTGFVWSHATGMLPLELLANGVNRASVVSADGTVIGGFAQGSFSRTPATWDAATQAGTLLDPPDGDALGEVHGISRDGTKLLGEWDGRAYVKEGDEMTFYDALIPGWIAIAFDIDDAGTIVGMDFLTGNRRAWIIAAGAEQPTLLKTYAESLGAEIPIALQVAQAISADGSMVIGHGFATGAWIIRFEPAECPGDTDGNGTVDVEDLLTVLAAWGDDTGSPADVNGDGIVDVQDLLIVLGAWGPC